MDGVYVGRWGLLSSGLPCSAQQGAQGSACLQGVETKLFAATCTGQTDSQGSSTVSRFWVAPA